MFDTQKDATGRTQMYAYDWFPSEYLYMENDNQYCMAADIQDQQNIMFGGTLMRQHAVIIDVENNRVGFVSTTCAFDPLQIKNEQELLDAGQKTAFSMPADNNDRNCDHYNVIKS